MPCKKDNSGNSSANGKDTGQANGTIRCRIRQDKDLKVTFIPEGNYCVERWEKKFAVFLPIANDGSSNDGSSNDGSSNDGSSNDGSSNDGSSNDGSSNDGSSLGFCIKLEDHGEVELELEGAVSEESERALLHAATHGTKVTVEVTRGDQEKLTLTAVTIPAK